MKYDKDDSRFKKIQIKDKFKIKRFKELGLTLIPFCIYKVKKTDMKDSLKKALIESGVSIPKTWESTSL
jgi:hypothetical protein